jgi:hypothetical protein
VSNTDNICHIKNVRMNSDSLVRILIIVWLKGLKIDGLSKNGILSELIYKVFLQI